MSEALCPATPRTFGDATCIGLYYRDAPGCQLLAYYEVFRAAHTSAINNMAAFPKKIGWVGLGIMGMPMALNLLKKTGSDTQLFVYDVVQDSIDALVKEGQGRVNACGSSKEVTDKSVRFTDQVGVSA